MDTNERCFRLYLRENWSWEQVAEEVGKPSANAARSAAYRFERDHPAEATKIRAALDGPAPSQHTDVPDLDKMEEGAGRNDLSKNVVEVWSAGYRIRSIDDLLQHFGLDDGGWERVVQTVGYYEGQQKKVKKDLRFDEGRITGIVKQDGALVVPMFKAYVKLVRTEPVAIQPVIQPIAPAQMPTREPPTPRRDGVIREIDFGDVHIGYMKRQQDAALIPFHDRRALDVLVQAAAHLQPDRIINMGDYLDCAEFSDKFVRLPEFYWTMQPAFMEGYYWNARLREAAPGAEMKQIEGNHEERLRDLLLKNFQVGYELHAVDELELPAQMTIERILALHDLDIAWVGNYPDGEVWAGGDRLSHGRLARKNPGSTAWAVLKEAATSEGFGHTHRRVLVSRTIWEQGGPRYISAWNGGCLCHIGERDPRGKRRGPPGVVARQNWQQGFTIREYAPGVPPSERFVWIQQGRAVIDGRVFVGRGDFDGYGGAVEDLQKMFPDWHW